MGSVRKQRKSSPRQVGASRPAAAAAALPPALTDADTFEVGERKEVTDARVAAEKEALKSVNVIVEIRDTGDKDSDRLNAAKELVAIAGVRKEHHSEAVQMTESAMKGLAKAFMGISKFAPQSEGERDVSPKKESKKSAKAQ